MYLWLERGLPVFQAWCSLFSSCLRCSVVDKGSAMEVGRVFFSFVYLEKGLEGLLPRLVKTTYSVSLPHSVTLNNIKTAIVAVLTITLDGNSIS